MDDSEARGFMFSYEKLFGAKEDSTKRDPGQETSAKKLEEMTIMNLPESQSLIFSFLMSDIEKGIIKIPQFQREFVWGEEKSAKLLDSIVKGYPQTLESLGFSTEGATNKGYTSHTGDIVAKVSRK